MKVIYHGKTVCQDKFSPPAKALKNSINKGINEQINFVSPSFALKTMFSERVGFHRRTSANFN